MPPRRALLVALLGSPMPAAAQEGWNWVDVGGQNWMMNLH